MLTRTHTPFQHQTSGWISHSGFLLQLTDLLNPLISTRFSGDVKELQSLGRGQNAFPAIEPHVSYYTQVVAWSSDTSLRSHKESWEPWGGGGALMHMHRRETWSAQPVNARCK